MAASTQPDPLAGLLREASPRAVFGFWVMQARLGLGSPGDGSRELRTTRLAEGLVTLVQVTAASRWTRERTVT